MNMNLFQSLFIFEILKEKRDKKTYLTSEVKRQF